MGGLLVFNFSMVLYPSPDLDQGIAHLFLEIFVQEGHNFDEIRVEMIVLFHCADRFGNIL